MIFAKIYPIEKDCKNKLANPVMDPAILVLTKHLTVSIEDVPSFKEAF